MTLLKDIVLIGTGRLSTYIFINGITTVVKT